ncbi:MAG: hypothetical protein RR514_07265 [Christensenella sp.]
MVSAPTRAGGCGQRPKVLRARASAPTKAEDYRKTLDIITKSETGQKWQKYMDGLLEQENGVPVMEICDAPVFFME